MASVMDCYSALRSAIIQQAALVPIVPPLVDQNNNPTVLIDTVPTQLCGLIAKGQVATSAISIFDYQAAHDVSRYHVRYSGLASEDPPPPAGITSSLSNWLLYPGQTVVLTVTGTPNLNDGLAFNVINGPVWSGATTAPATVGQTLAATLAQLSANINSDTTLNQLVTAVVSGSTIRITSITNVGLKVMTTTGNVGYATREWIRLKHPVLIKTFSATHQQREELIILLNQIIGQLQSQANPLAVQFCAMPDGTWARYTVNSAKVHRDYHLPSLFSYDLIVNCEFSVTTQDKLWSVLTQNVAITGGVEIP